MNIHHILRRNYTVLKTKFVTSTNNEKLTKSYMSLSAKHEKHKQQNWLLHHRGFVTRNASHPRFIRIIYLWRKPEKIAGLSQDSRKNLVRKCDLLITIPRCKITETFHAVFTSHFWLSSAEI